MLRHSHQPSIFLISSNKYVSKGYCSLLLDLVPIYLPCFRKEICVADHEGGILVLLPFALVSKIGDSATLISWFECPTRTLISGRNRTTRIDRCWLSCSSCLCLWAGIYNKGWIDKSITINLKVTEQWSWKTMIITTKKIHRTLVLEVWSAHAVASSLPMFPSQLKPTSKPKHDLVQPTMLSWPLLIFVGFLLISNIFPYQNSCLWWKKEHLQRGRIMGCILHSS